MRIGIVGRFYDEGFATLLAEECAHLGHEVARVEVGVFSSVVLNLPRALARVASTAAGLLDQTQIGSDLLTRRLDDLASQKPDLTIVCHDFLTQAQVARMKSRTRSPIVMWFPDHVAQFRRMQFATAPYDKLFFKDPYQVALLRREPGLPAFYLPECFSPRRHSLDEPGDLSAYECDIATAGNLYPTRVATFAHLTKYHIRLWGHAPPRWLDVPSVAAMYQGRYVLYEEKARAFLGARIVLNNLHAAEVAGINVRAFEICGAGGFQLISWRPALASLFRDSEELVSYVSMADLAEKIDFYLAAPDRRRRIAAAGKRRAHAEHTYAHRLKVLFATVRDEAAGEPIPRMDAVSLMAPEQNA
jgi:spore maturation protein CgeB